MWNCYLLNNANFNKILQNINSLFHRVHCQVSLPFICSLYKRKVYGDSPRLSLILLFCQTEQHAVTVIIYFPFVLMSIMQQRLTYTRLRRLLCTRSDYLLLCLLSPVLQALPLRPFLSLVTWSLHVPCDYEASTSFEVGAAKNW